MPPVLQSTTHWRRMRMSELKKFHVGYKDLIKIFVWSPWCTEASNAQECKHYSHNWKKNLKIMKIKLCTINRTALLIQHWKHFTNIKEFIETFRHKIDNLNSYVFVARNQSRCLEKKVVEWCFLCNSRFSWELP